MENKKTLAKILGFVAMGLAIISIPMVFLKIIEGGNLINLFNYVNDTVELYGEDYVPYYVKIYPWIYIIGAVFALAGAVLSAFQKKLTRILALSANAVALLVVDIGLTASLAQNNYNFKGILTVIFTYPGNLLYNIFLILAIIASVAALVVAIMAEKEAPEFSGAFQPYNQQADGAFQGEFNNVSYSAENQQAGVIANDDTVILNQGSITFLTGSCAGFQIPVSSTEVLIGKDPARCQVVIGMEHTKVSRCHCGVKFDATEGYYIVTDYSSNGTFNADGNIQIAMGSPSYLDSGTILALADGANTFRLD